MLLRDRYFRAGVWFGLVAAFALGGCAGNSTDANLLAKTEAPLTTGAGVTVAPILAGPTDKNDAPTASGHLASITDTADKNAIVGFKGSTITLFTTAASHEGERVSSSTVSVPLKLRAAGNTSSRVEIMTVYGPRWVARSELVLGPSS